MLFKVAGFQYGSAKNIKPVIVRAAARTGPNAVTVQPENYLEGVVKVLDDVSTHEKKAILSMSWFYLRKVKGHWTFPDPEDKQKDGSLRFQIQLRMLLQELVNKGVSPITKSGNNDVVSARRSIPVAR